MLKITTRTARATVSAALLLGAVTTASADDGITTTFSGYGTLGGTFTSNTHYAYIHDPTEFTGASGQFDVPLESRLGLQAVVDFGGTGFSVTAQELARERGSTDFSLGTEWLYMQYAPDSDWKFRLGRVVVSTFLLSDSRNVGYAAPWFRAPNEVYSSESIQSLDGGQVLWSKNLGPIGLGLQGSFGSAKEDYLVQSNNTVSSLTIKNMYNVSASLTYQNLLLRMSQTILDVPTSIPLGPYTANFAIKDKFRTIGLQYDDGSAIVLTEFARRTDNNVPLINETVSDNKQWYAAGGWRFGKLTPMVIYGNYTTKPSLANTYGDFGTWSASLRYDVVRNIALKAQVSRPQAGNGAYWLVPNNTTNERINVISLGADFVF